MIEPENVSSNYNDSDDTDDSNNLDLIYEYTNSILQAVSADTNTINTKLGTVIAFDGILVRTAMDLPDHLLKINSYPCYSCLLIKVLVFSLLIISIWFGIRGLTTRPFASVVRPGELLDNWYREDSEICKIFILKGLRQAVEGLDRERSEKSRALNRALILLALAASLYGIGALIPSLSSLL